MRKRLSRSLLLFASLLGTPVLTHPEQHITGRLSYSQDQRFVRLKAYLKKRRSPAADLSADFLAAADRHDLDWRLLPAIAVVESGAGLRYTNNNIFGWGSGTVRFSSLRAGIHHVASRLGNSKLYRHKDLDGVLRTYNPYASYPGRVKKVMRTLAPSAEILPAAGTP